MDTAVKGHAPTMEVTDPQVARIVKGLDSLKAKISKLTEENARLKQQLAELKASQSRIRRIPKKSAEQPES